MNFLYDVQESMGRCPLQDIYGIKIQVSQHRELEPHQKLQLNFAIHTFCHFLINFTFVEVT